MKFSNTAILALAASAVVVEAAPAPVTGKSTNQIAKREDLERALAQLLELHQMKVKRDDLAAELSEREYAIVTEVLTAITDTDLAPVVLKYFISNDTLKTLTIDSLVWVIKSGLISAKSLFSLLVQSGLVTDVLNDLLSNCEVYASIIKIAELAVGSIVSSLFSKRTVPYTYEEGYEMLKRDGLIQPTIFDDIDDEELAKRDYTSVVVNLLESLGSSGLATQVVEAVLTDSTYLSFGAELIKELYSQGLLSLSSLVSAISSSGLLSELVKEFLNFSTLKTIFSTAVSAFDGDCSSSTTSNSTLTLTTLTSTSTSTSTGSTLSSLLSSLTSGSLLLSGVGSLLSSFLGSSSSSSSLSTTTATTAATVAADSTVACSTAVYKRERLRMY